MYVQVTQADIDQALRGNSYHCVVANAVARLPERPKKIVVDAQTVRFSLPDRHKRYVYMTPAAIQQYIIDFDAGDALHPFSFHLTKPIWTGPTSVGGSNRQGAGTAHLRLKGPKSKELRVPTRAPAIRPHGAYREFGLRLLRQNREGE